MRIKTFYLHNFRSILDSGEVSLDNLSLLVGPNNAGKSNILSALRVLYDEEKFNAKRDLPSDHLKPVDTESWIDVTYELTQEEYDSLPDYAKGVAERLHIRKYFKSDDPGRYQSNQSNIFAYQSDGTLYATPFHGAKNVSEAKIGKIIFIPSVNKIDDTMKLSGPSPWKQIATFVFEQISDQSNAFSNLDQAFESFDANFRSETSSGGHSLHNLEADINRCLEEWNITFNVQIRKLKIEDIVKNLLNSTLKDQSLGGSEIDPNLYGQGFQRHLIYTLIRLSAKYTEKKKRKKKEFSPDYTLILFEEPEAFLHPAQQEVLSASLIELASASENNVQVLLSTHSPLFVSRNVNDLSGIIKLHRNNGATKVSQINDNDEQSLFGQNGDLTTYLGTVASDPNTPQEDVADIKKILGNQDPAVKAQIESIKYFLWMNSERAALFFADFVFICEGTTEKILLDYLIRTDQTWKHLRQKRIYFLDADGKYNIHRYMNLLKLLCLNHAVMIDDDGDKRHHKYLNQYIEANKNSFTSRVEKFSIDFETFLGVRNQSIHRHDKPAWVFLQYQQGLVDSKRIDELRAVVERCIS